MHARTEAVHRRLQGRYGSLVLINSEDLAIIAAMLSMAMFRGFRGNRRDAAPVYNVRAETLRGCLRRWRDLKLLLSMIFVQAGLCALIGSA